MKKSIISISLLMFSGSLIFARDFRPDILEAYENNIDSVSQAQQTQYNGNSSSSSKYETVSLSLENSNTNNSIQNGTTFVNNSYSNLPNVKERASYDRLSNLPKLTPPSYFKDYSNPGLRIGFFVTDTFFYNLCLNGPSSEKTVMRDDFMYLGKIAYEVGGGCEIGIKGGKGHFYNTNVWDLMFTFMYSQNFAKIDRDTYCGLETGVGIGVISAVDQNWYDSCAAVADCSFGMFFDVSDFRVSFDIVYSCTDYFMDKITGKKLEGQLAWNAGISYKF